jgi:hypothetical protein
MKKKKSKKIVGKTFEWKAPEFSQTPKEKSWFIIPAIITIVLGIFALFTENFIFLILIIIAFVVFYIYAKKEPRIIRFKINIKGIEVDKKLYEFNELKSFWLFYNPPEQKELSIRSKKSFIPYIKIPLTDEDPNEIRKFLLNFLSEKPHKESLIEIWMRKIGF